ncbi:ABC transporter substrate-binding protein [Phreatobacter stygius]|uniref:ABC transporter substrate-binding protein n=1 Tax=Phreatobacter stygius TaxID=1940610 RepID=A0A4D7AWG4_9HYPH|nr:ABC transporter substrate-binding protein [Phreatobacter stygius]QCI64321.1 ABC transporter substrate-binding protein [Phreatobacter stygius]
MANRRRFLLGLAATALPGRAALGQALEPVSFGTNWVAQAEHGGFYQAVADGTYRAHGLEVTVVPGGPQVNNRLLLAAGRLDFYMGGNMIQAFAAVDQNVPTTVVAALFQKEPQVLIAHPGQGIESFADLKRLPTIFISQAGVATFWQWMKAEHGFRDEQLKPYTFNAQPFLADKRSAMQGYLTSEPYAIERSAGFTPKVFLLADQGFDPYGSTIEIRRAMLTERASTVQRFVEASIIGWYNYVYGDNSAANGLIKRANPDMDDGKIAYALARMREHGIVDSGDSLTLGIGTVTEARVKGFFDKLVKSGIARPTLDWRQAFDPRFVNRGLGRELRKAL